MKGKKEEVKKEQKKEEKKEEVRKNEKSQQLALITPHVTTKEHVVVKTLVSLPHTTSSVSPTRPRKATIVYTLSTSSQGGVKDIEEEIDLEEVVTIPKFDL